MRLRQFLRMASGVGALNALERSLSLALGIVLARWLDVEGYGQYAFVMGIASMVTVLARVGIPGVLMRNIAASGKDAERGDPRTLVRRGVAVVLCSSMATVAVGLAAAHLATSADNRSLQLALLAGLLLVPVNALLEAASFALRGCQRIVEAQFLGGTVPAIGTLALVVIAAFALDLPGMAALGLAARIVAVGAGLFVVMLLLWRVLPASSAAARSITPGARALLVISMPFVLINGANMVLARSDVVMLGFMAREHDVGLYNAAMQGALLVQMVLQISVAVSSAEFAKLHAGSSRAALEAFAVSTARVSAALSMLVAAPLALFGRPILVTLFGEDFGAGAEALAILALGNLAAVSFGAPGVILTMTGHHNDALRIVVYAAILNIVLNAILIPSFGIAGAAVATSISQVLWKFLAYLAVGRRLGIACAAFSRGRMSP